jgi:hypothetical protein
MLGVPAYCPAIYTPPDESHVIELPTSAPAESTIREYWYVPDELNLETNAAAVPPELAGNVPNEVPAWSFIVGVPAYCPVKYTFPDESHTIEFPSSAPAESTIREYWYVPDELNFEKNAVFTVPTLAGRVPKEVPA